MTAAPGAGPYLHVGKHRKTRESSRFVLGQGTFLADLRMPGLLDVAFVRSPLAHGWIDGVDVSAAEGMLGVHSVLTGAEAARLAKPAFTLAAFHDPPLPVPLRALADDKVRYRGEGVAAVAATSRAAAEDAAARVHVAYTELPPVLSIEDALRPGAPLVHDGLERNVLLHRHYDFGPVDQVFREAATVVRRTVRWPRQTGAPLDTFGCIVEWNAQGLTVWSNHQSHAMLWTLGGSLGLPPEQVRSVPCDIGGAFGGKFWQPRPVLVCALLSRKTGRPVRYVEDRVEHFVAGENHGEDRTYEAELALNREGAFTGLRLDVVEDYGAAFVLGAINNAEPLAQATGPYRMDALGVDFTGVVTNKTAQAAYRGFGGAAMTFLLERLVDAAAKDLDRDRIELRRQNLIPAGDFPYRTPTGNIYDSGQYERGLDMALELADLSTWRKRQAAARGSGREIGIGIVTCSERSVQAGSALWVMFDQNPSRGSTAAESVSVRIDAQGKVRVALHSPSLGTPIETVAATVVAEELGIDPEGVVVSLLDSRLSGPSLGPNASRMTVMLSGAVQGAAHELIMKMRPIAADMLEAAEEDLVWSPKEASFTVLAVPDSPTAGLAEIARRAYGAALTLPEGSRSGLESTFTYDHPMSTMPAEDGSSWGSFAPIVGYSVHVPVVEVDTETGEVTFLDYAVVHDCGTVVNPAAVRGQVIGGIVQGAGTALSEVLEYDDAGRLKQHDFRSYFVPTTLDAPLVRLGHLETPSPFTAYGVKGVGEGGRMAAPAAIVSAVEDALKPWGAHFESVPVTPEAVLAWTAPEESRAPSSARRV